jgi:oligopeptide transport system substrate-binding protein
MRFARGPPLAARVQTSSIKSRARRRRASIVQLEEKDLMSHWQKSYRKCHSRLRLLPLGFCLLLLTACNIFGGNPAQVKVPGNQQVYTVPVVGVPDFNTLDPALVDDAASINAVQMIFTGLVQLDDHLQLHPQLAQSWQVNSDGVTWIFHLKPHLKFSDGTPLTSADVAYSIDRALQPKTQSPVAPIYLSLIKDANQLISGKISTLINDSILTPDPNTVVIVTSQPAPYFLSMLTYPCSYVVEKSLVTKYGPQFTDHLNAGGGAGPFKVAQFTHRVSLSFVPNSYYYDAKPQLQKVNFRFYPSAERAYQDYLNNRLDTAPVPLSSVTSARKRKDFIQEPQLWINYYAMNYLTKPFDNIHIRQAFALAVDKTAIAKNVWKNTVIPTNHIVPQGMDGYNPALTGPDGTTQLSGNFSKAQQLFKQGMQEEGWSSVSQLPPITLTYASGVSGFDQEAQTLTQDWKKVLGVDVTTNAVDYNTLLDQVTASTNNANGLQMWGLAWVDEYPDPHDWLTLQFGRGAVYNNENYGENFSSTASRQQLLQIQLAQTDGMFNNSERMQRYQQEEQQLVDDVAWLPMEQATSTFVRTPHISGIVDNAQGIIPPDDWANIYRTQ